MIIQLGLFHHIYHIGCAFNLHSIINNGLIPGGQDLSRRQTVFFLLTDPRDKEHQDPEHIDFSVPRRENTCTVHGRNIKTRYFWLILILRLKRDHHSIKRGRMQLSFKELPAYCISKVVRLKTGEVLYEKSYMSPRPPPKISLRHDHDWTRGKFHWVLQLINSQKVKLFDSHEEKFNTQRSPN